MLKPNKQQEEKETGRIEAFSDGVFAVAITLLVLDIKVPHASDLGPTTTLAHALLQEWPQFLAYVTSFATILIMWMNHHKLFNQIRRTDHWFLLWNGLLLLWVTLVPFPTALVAEFIHRKDASFAAAIYSGTFILISIFFNLVWRYAAHNNRLLKADKDDRFIRITNRQYVFGPIIYLIAFALAFVNVTASVTACMLLAVFFALPIAPDR
ncbi:MAG TPA: TMEM175 family protein [Chthonomonadaceae bacterium]|nr:TMEM175 family protein [Chthonomonadaceae bacterium]